MASLSLLTLKRGLLLFWAIWFSIVSLTNLLDALRALRVLSATWAFASGNWDFLVSTAAIYATPRWLLALLFAGVIAWEVLAAVSFWRTVATRPGASGVASGAAVSAFIVGIALMAAFIVADEIFITYEVEATHLRLFTAQLLSLLAVVLLPDDPAKAAPSPLMDQNRDDRPQSD